MMTDNRISEAIQEVMAESTFTEGTLAKFKDALGRVRELEGEVVNLKRDLEGARREGDIHRAEVMRLEKRLEGVDERERAVAEREQQCHKKEIDQAADKARAAATTEITKLVFGNIGVHRSIYGQVPMADGHGGYPTQQQFNKDETVTESITPGTS